jgi:hypothetical protein
MGARVGGPASSAPAKLRADGARAWENGGSTCKDIKDREAAAKGKGRKQKTQKFEKSP